jgi:catechol-2,3-dioxygenase
VSDAPHGIRELALEAADLDPMIAFYEGLGLTVTGREPGRVWMEAGGDARLGIWSPGPKEHRDRGGHHVHFALAVSPGALDAAVSLLEDTVGEFEGPVVHEGGDRSVYAFDPEGNRVELWERARALGR